MASATIDDDAKIIILQCERHAEVQVRPTKFKVFFAHHAHFSDNRVVNNKLHLLA
jgi:hypothetical protein